MNKHIITLAIIASFTFLFAGKPTSDTTTYVGFNGTTVDEIKKSFNNNSVSFVIFTPNGFDKEAFVKKSEQYSKMFSIKSETVSNNTTYSVKFLEGFKDMKYLMRLFITAEIKEIHFGSEIMTTEKFFAQFNSTTSKK